MLRAGFSRLAAYAPAYVSGAPAEHGPPSPHAAPLARISAEAAAGGSGLSCVTRQFDFGRLVAAFEAVRLAGGGGAACGLPQTVPFLRAMDEVLLLFDHLGSAFAFVRRDIGAKTAILRAYAVERAPRFGDLEAAVLAEVAAGTAAAKPPPSAARTLLRLMWALKFIDCLLAYLREATRPRSPVPPEDATLRAAVAHAYAAALAEHHSWALRKTVRAALALLPTSEAFMEKVCPDERLRAPYLARLAGSMTPLREAMYAFYEKHGLLALP